MPVEHITSRAKFVEAITQAAGVAGMADVTGQVVDMSGFEGIAFVVTFGVITATALTSIKLQRGNAANMSDAADIEGSAQAVADSDDGKTFISDIYRPGERYVQGIVDRGVANAEVRAAFYILYGASENPVAAQGSTVVVERLVDKVEGTA